MTTRDPMLDEQWTAFGKWLTELQEQMKPVPSDRQLARDVGLSPTHIGALKRGLTGTKKPIVIKLAHALGADPNIALKMAGMDGGAPNESDVQLGRRLGAILKNLGDDDKRKRIERLLETDAQKYVSLVSSAA